MISDIKIHRYKSITDIDLPLGRVNVFIGENGAGKSNILEAIALGGAAAAGKLDNEFLVSRGIRVASAENMRPAFSGADPAGTISVEAKTEGSTFVEYIMQNDNTPYSKWDIVGHKSLEVDLNDLLKTIVTFTTAQSSSENQARKESPLFKKFLKVMRDSVEVEGKADGKKKKEKRKGVAFDFVLDDEDDEFAKALKAVRKEQSPTVDSLSKFIIFSPENSALRTLQREGQIEPLGINGEGLLKMFSFYEKLSCAEPENELDGAKIQRAKNLLLSVKKSLKLFNWFEDVKLRSDALEDGLEIKDRFVGGTDHYFEHSSANEGFLFILFYFLLFSSDLTPPFFAVDNIDASLNPGLCRELTKRLVRLAKDNDKQVILTTHNPAILDGLDLNDDDQRLFIISRDIDGETKLKRFVKKTTDDESIRPKLSELFLRGIIGGLPKTF
ncbi:AAA family ATPase [Paraburkholderia aspalathi]|uniref:AAA family ATPase n=1 Tax=Paraburkholderia aspalathi TaxID=1324617 RepID=UPI0038B916F6